MKTRNIPLWQISSHEFSRALRVLRREIVPIDILKMLVAERSKSLAMFIKSIGIALLGTLWVASKSKGGLIEINAFTFQFEIPTAYVSFFLVTQIVGALVAASSYMYMNEFVRIATNRLFKFDNSSAIAMFFRGDSAWSIGSLPQFRFYESSYVHKLQTWVTLIFALCPILAILVFIYYQLLKGILIAFCQFATAPLGAMLAAISLMMLIDLLP